jgi:hypothetical protein
MNKKGMSKMNKFLMSILVILILIIALLGLGVYYVKSSENSGWKLPKYSVSGKVIYEPENNSIRVGNVCREGQKKCFSQGYIECKMKNGILNWGEITFCEKNQICMRGECIDG